MRSPLIALAVTLAGFVAVTGAADGQVRHDSAAPIDFRAPFLDVQDRANRAMLSGGVTIKQAEMTLQADRVGVTYSGTITNGDPEVTRLDASGGVTITRPTQSARSQYAVYDLNKGIITLIGNVELRNNGDVVRGPRLVMDLNDNRTVLGGGSNTNGGVVTGRFSVPKRAAGSTGPAPQPSATPGD